MANKWTTLDIVKSQQYIGIDETTYDADITSLIEDITEQMIDYVDNDDIDSVNGTDVLRRACALQVTFEWKRRKDKGISSTTYPDGTINKIIIDEWLPDVAQILKRNMEYAI